jgi:hypothetical protein
MPRRGHQRRHHRRDLRAGGTKACSVRLRHRFTRSRINKGAHAEALRQAHGRSERSHAAWPCRLLPESRHADACASARLIKDVDLPNVIDETKVGTLLVLWPEAAYFPQDQVYVAYMDVDVLQKGKLVPGPFYVGYRDWKVRTRTACRQRSRRRPRNWRAMIRLRHRSRPVRANAVRAGRVAKQAGGDERRQVGQHVRHRASTAIASCVSMASGSGSAIRRSARWSPTAGVAATSSRRYSAWYAASAARRDSARSTIGAG